MILVSRVSSPEAALRAVFPRNTFTMGMNIASASSESEQLSTLKLEISP